MRAEVRLAERLGVAPRRLWGDEPRVRLVPDGDGFTVVREPEFTPEDVELLLAAKQAEDAISPRGIEWATELDPNARFEVGTGGLPTKNYAIAAVENARSEYTKAYPDEPTAALLWPVRLA